ALAPSADLLTQTRRQRPMLAIQRQAQTTRIAASPAIASQVFSFFRLSARCWLERDMPAGEHPVQLAGLMQLGQRLVDGLLQVAVGLSHRGTDRKTIF